MKKFEILRYLKRFSLLIFLVSLAGAAAIYLYADGRQKYTASVIIRYTNDGISDGYTPDGSELDVNEIYSSTVISQAMDALGASGRLSTIRSNISVTPVISEDQETINEALLQKGEEVTYFPDTYKVSLVVDGEQGAGYARNMLDAIIHFLVFRLAKSVASVPEVVYLWRKNPKGLTATSQHRPAAVQSYWIMEQLAVQDAALGLPHDALYRCSLTLQLSAFCYATVSGLPPETQQAVFRLCCALYAKALPQEGALPRRARWGARALRQQDFGLWCRYGRRFQLL